MRVALVDPSLFTLPYDTALAVALRSAGVDVEFHGREMTLADGGSRGIAVRPSFYRIAGGSFGRRLPKVMRLALKGVDHVASMRRLLVAVRAEEPDVIHFQWLPLPLIDSVFLRRLRAVAPVVLTVHDTDPFNGSPTARLQSMGFLRSLHGCDRLIVHTAQGMQRLISLGIAANRIIQLPHGPLADHPTGCPPDPMLGEIVFTLFGKIKPYKGADLLIEAFSRLPANLRSQARMRIIGQAYIDVEALRDLARHHGVLERLELDVRFVADDEMQAIFAPGTVAVFPYREIEASGVLSLALAAGRPVIASRLGSFAEMLTDGVHGRLVSAGDVGALADALAAVISDRACAARYAAAAGTLALALPGWNEIARMTAACYSDVLADAFRQRAPQAAPRSAMRGIA